MKNKIITAVVLLVLPVLVAAHGGGLDKNGGHNDRKSGGYHCHKASCVAHGNNNASHRPRKLNQVTKKSV